MTKLSRASLANLPAAVRTPAFDPARVRPGIVHLGFGNFHRAHMARYADELMGLDPAALEWGLVGAGLMAGDRKVVDALAPQDWLYTLVERDADSETAKIIGSVADVILAAGDPEPLQQAIARPETRIVSLTVTEHGYCLNRATKRLDLDHPAVRADIADPRRPGSAPGVIVEAYRRRMAAGGRAFTAMSCDNIQHNGHVLRQAVLDLAEALDPALAAWIAEHGRFPSTMVDRITPVTQVEDVADLARRHGVEDAWPVFSETFSQWVVEDNFADGRPDWDRVGAQFVDDVAPYEFMKLRLLNASHLAISGPGRLMGYTYIDETMRDSDVRAYMGRLVDRETGPTLLPTPGVDIAAYKRQLIERFANPNIHDTVERVNTDAALNYLLDPIRDRLAQGQPIDLLAFAVAAWLRRMRGDDEQGAPIDIRHPLAGLLRERAVEGGGDPMPMLRIDQLFGDLAEDAAFTDAVGRWFGLIHASGVRHSLQRALAD